MSLPLDSADKKILLLAVLLLVFLTFMAVLFSPELNAQAFLIFDAQFGWALIDSVFSRASMSAKRENSAICTCWGQERPAT